MALDEPRDTDEAFDIDGFKFIVDKEFMQKIQPVKIDFGYMGFKVNSEFDFGGQGCTSCSTTQSCCST